MQLLCVILNYETPEMTLDAARAALMGQDGNEAVHLAVEFQFLRNFAANRLERATQIVNRKAGDFGNQPIGRQRR